MTIKVGDRLPAGTLQEFYDVEKDGCSIGPNPVTIENLTQGQEGRAVRTARRVHADVLGEARAELPRRRTTS